MRLLALSKLASIGVVGLALLLFTVATLTTGDDRANQSYPYHSAQFTEFVEDSFRVGGTGTAKSFYDWMERAYTKGKVHYPGKERLALEQLLDDKRFELGAMTDRKRKAQAETNLGAWLHRVVKSDIPKFSLERGFEFRYTVTYGERQCFLQSVLIAGMLQRAGVQAGVAMVYQNISGEETNNGHAVTILKLSNGRDIIVDASEPTPFARHKGLFMSIGEYGYVNPTYARSSNTITGYTLARDRSILSTSKVRPLDVRFLMSQFWYYRGERASGGLLAKHSTQAGLQASARALKISVNLCDRNPLAVLMLSRTYYALGNMILARRSLARAESLYSKSGWTPSGIKDHA